MSAIKFVGLEEKKAASKGIELHIVLATCDVYHLALITGKKKVIAKKKEEMDPNVEEMLTRYLLQSLEEIRDVSITLVQPPHQPKPLKKLVDFIVYTT